MKGSFKIFSTISLISLLSVITSCKKIIDTQLPNDRLTVDYVFTNATDVNAAVLNMYVYLSSQIGAGSFTNPSYYIDELVNINGSGGAQTFYPSVLFASTAESQWRYYYQIIYQANALIVGLTNNSAIDLGLQARYLGEAQFMRAYAYFNLINIYGDVPLVLTTDVNISSHASRSTTSSVYAQIISDLKAAKQNLLGSYTGEQKVRATKWAASALLAKVYLYQKDWQDATSEASNVINSNTFTLQTDLNTVFLVNSNEAILQVWNANGYVAGVGNSFTPTSATAAPTYTISSSLLNSFSVGDKRRTNWINTTVVKGQTYNYVYKYKVRAITTGSNAEYYSIFRLAEMYLIRAEAEEQQNDVIDAVIDINQIHTRAGLAPISATGLTQVQCDVLLQTERQNELFCEDYNRFFDLKRTGTINNVMSAIKPAWNPTAALYPIPLSEIQKNPNLTQNPGY